MGASGSGVEYGTFYPLLISLLLVAFAIFCGWVFIVYLKRSTLIKVRDQLAHQTLKLTDTNAVFFGVESKGPKQIRGNGVLALTDKELYFHGFGAKEPLIIPRMSIQTLTTPNIFLTKSCGKELFQVNYMTEEGKEEAVAWYTPLRESFELEINEAMSKGTDT